jgi:hypothetical protein
MWRPAVRTVSKSYPNPDFADILLAHALGQFEVVENGRIIYTVRVDASSACLSTFRALSVLAYLYPKKKQVSMVIFE